MLFLKYNATWNYFTTQCMLTLWRPKKKKEKAKTYTNSDLS